ncbi:MAG: topoisomerase C-terminal repeat-containing protein, partial [Bacteroidia bacterium]
NLLTSPVLEVLKGKGIDTGSTVLTELIGMVKERCQLLGDFYTPFHETVAKTVDTAERVTGERLLGTDPKSGLPILARMGRYGALVQKGDKDSGVDPAFASLRAGQTLESIQLEEALKLFELPRDVCSIDGEAVTAAVGRYGPYLKFKGKFFNVPAETDLIALSEEQAQSMMAEFLSQPQYPLEVGSYKGQPLLVNKGRFGPYVKYDKIFASIPKGEDPSTLTEERAIQLVEAKLSGEKSAALKELDAELGISIVDGRYGAYIKQGKVNAPIPKGTDWKDVSLEQAKSWLEEAATKKKSSPKKRK